MGYFYSRIFSKILYIIEWGLYTGVRRVKPPRPSELNSLCELGSFTEPVMVAGGVFMD